MRICKYIILPLALYSFPAFGGCAAEDNVQEQGDKLMQVMALFMKDVESGLLPESNLIKNDLQDCCVRAYDLCEKTETHDEFTYVLKENTQFCQNIQVVAFTSRETYILYVYCVESYPLMLLAVYKRVKGKWNNVTKK